MPVIKFVEANGTEYEADAAVGSTVMQAALDNMVDGILAECGGSCSCATCHCYIDNKFLKQLPEPSAGEQAMLAAVIDPKENSRLACQVEIADNMEGMVVNLPASQF
ncbi:MAG: 2Fe-2S iron-sulfur cluster binding domain-containing protein [Cellvibrionaceae bacterium]